MIKIIDTHLHFWNLTQLRYPWLDEFPALNVPILPDSIPISGEGWQVEKLIFMQADCLPEQGLAEAQWVTELAEHDSRIAGIVAFAPVEQGEEMRSTLDAFRWLPLVKGIRRLIQAEAAGFCTQPDFIAGVKLCAAYGYPFDLCIKHHQLGDVITLVGQCPEVKFVLDHAGKPNIQQQQIEPWREQITTLAQFPNVSCKLSGMVTEADLDHWQPSDLQPYITHVLEAFGVNRVMFGSDSPVFRLAHTTYERWLELVLDATKHYSESERQQIFYENAAQFYRV